MEPDLRPSDCIFDLAIVAGERSRELAINSPFETPELVHLIRLIKRAMDGRKVLTRSVRGIAGSAGDWSRGVNGVSGASVICWPALTPAAGLPKSQNHIEITNEPETTSGSAKCRGTHHAMHSGCAASRKLFQNMNVAA